MIKKEILRDQVSRLQDEIVALKNGGQYTPDLIESLISIRDVCNVESANNANSAKDYKRILNNISTMITRKVDKYGSRG